MILLAGDIGGTKSWLRAVKFGAQTSLLADRRYSSQAFDSLSSVIEQFKADFNLIEFDSACFGLPGPVQGRISQLTNLPWRIDADHIQQQCHIHRVELINDFQAAAFGIDALSANQLVTLHPGEFDPNGNRLVIGAGTGLGVAPIVKCKDGYWPQPCEGGHMDFAPEDEVQQALLQWLWQLWPHVSYERLLSGSGLETLYAFFADLPVDNQQAWLKAEQVHQAANQGEPSAIKALHTFVEIYGGYIGNAALLWPARAGIYIAGGIASKIEQWMRNPVFLHQLHNKGRMRELLMKMPVHLVTDPALGLMGALKRAELLTELH